MSSRCFALLYLTWIASDMLMCRSDAADKTELFNWRNFACVGYNTPQGPTALRRPECRD